RLAAQHATFGLTEVRWAIMPGAGGTQRLPRAVPLARGVGVVLMGGAVSAVGGPRVRGVQRGGFPAGVRATARRRAGTLGARRAGGEGGGHSRPQPPAARWVAPRGSAGRHAARDRGRDGRAAGVRREAETAVQRQMTPLSAAALELPALRARLQAALGARP